ncbi:L,D-transpeptidase family protein [Niabella drilacis]|uniref:L,D-transpeptidase catalytic domain n=1 Tax=Niabella drilacis (strain DSM 25811 / CCM 8410 / CCUG 62505 / LMG 26954 / E90) TaxID=1285928 RepID=A0A1G6ZGK5_NIADE|nr:L,D-transpeptidase family protein [Niabella drilacis]SDE01710.1 L,D-transpeptidase catalytic domain [Niabella drilacis]
MALKLRGKRGYFVIASIFTFSIFSSAQNSYTPPVSYGAFFDAQTSLPRPKESFQKKGEYLKNLFKLKGLDWPAKYVYLRSFKYDSQLEVWVKNSIKDEYKLLKIYKVCALAGSLGPKRFEGDYQVPEGFYYINEFNPNSTYYLSLGLNYPNASDRILSDQAKPGGDIFIHGGCATVGCIPIKNDQIDELYLLTAGAKSAGLDYIPVHIFPINYSVKRSYEYLNKMLEADPSYKALNVKLEEAFEYFEQHKQLPVVMTKDNGEYVINDAPVLAPRFQPKQRPKSDFVPSHRKVDFIADAVAKWPEYPGGAAAFSEYVKRVGAEMVKALPDSVTHAYVQLEFIIDKDGSPVNFKILKGGVDDYFDKVLLSKLEKMPAWSPAILREKPVAKKMVQTIAVNGE